MLMRIQMELTRILIHELNAAQHIELRDMDPADGHPRSFSISIGLTEAIAIDRRLSGLDLGRPLTHDLLSSIIMRLGSTLESIVIHKIVDQTFHAFLSLTDSSGKTIEIDARPSDAIALGIASDVPIFVDESVINHPELPRNDLPRRPL